MKADWGSLKRFGREQQGVAAIELALVAPILVASALCAGDLGRFALQKTWVTYAASAGAEYAVAHGFTAAKIATAATSAAPVSGISIRACLQLRRMAAQARWTAARKILASLS